MMLSPGMTVRAQGLFERLGFGPTTTGTVESTARVVGLSQDDMVKGLRAALGKGVEHAVGTLGASNGFLADLSVRIPVPPQFHSIERALRKLGQEALVDGFVTTMNRAAEQAAPQAAAVLADALTKMTLVDAEKILTGATNAATEYFRKTSETNLYARFYPIVQKATADAGVTAAFKLMMDKAPALSTFLSPDLVDLDAYVTRKALAGLFLKTAEEEKRIRESPVARTSDVLPKVFGAIKR
jgi:hypothetical protein